MGFQSVDLASHKLKTMFFNLQVGICAYGGLTSDTQIFSCMGSVPLTPMSFMGQLYNEVLILVINVNNIDLSVHLFG